MKRATSLLLIVPVLLLMQCSDDDDNGGGTTSACNVSSIEWRYGEYSEMEYDSDGNLTDIYEYDEDGSKMTHFHGKITYSNNKISEIKYYDENENLLDDYWIEYTYTGSLLSKRTVHEGDNYTETRYTFSDGNPVLMEYFDNVDGVYGYDSLVWTDGNVTELYQYEDGTAAYYAYSKMQYDSHENGLQLLGGYIYDDAYLLSDNNVLSLTGVDNNANINNTYAYTYNDDGYPSQIKITYKETYLDNSTESSDVWKFTNSCD